MTDTNILRRLGTTCHPHDATYRVPAIPMLGCFEERIETSAAAARVKALHTLHSFSLEGVEEARP